MKIVLTQFYSKNVSYGEFAEKINTEYCKISGYDYYCEKDDEKIKTGLEDRAYTWYKPKLILEVFEKFNPDYILFLDIDAIVCNFNYKIEEFIDDKYNIICTQDYGPSRLNAGVFLMKNSEWTKDTLKKWWNLGFELNNGYYKNALWHDQTCFGHIIDNSSDSSENIKIISNKVLNGRYFRDPSDNNFIFHAFSYGAIRNRTIDNAYYKIFNIAKPEGEEILDVINFYPTDKHHEHNYFSLIYNDLFKQNYLEIKKFIEIGVYQGNSIELWRDYFKNAQIIGADINLDLCKDVLSEDNLERITLKKLDQSDENQLEEFASEYNDVDIILDDCSHRMRDQQITFAKLFKMLKSGGIYIIEDLHTSLEVVRPEKRIFGWGDPEKTITLNMLKEFKETKKIKSDYMSDVEMKYLNENILDVEIYQSRPDWSITSIIIKK